MSDMSAEQVDNLTSAIDKLAKTREQSQPGAPDAEGGRYAAALDGSKEIADQLAKADMEKEDAHRAAVKAEVAEQVKAALSSIRTPSMAAAIGTGTAAKAKAIHQSVLDAHPLVRAAYEASGGSFEPGQFITAVAAASSSDADDQAVGKSALRSMGAMRMGAPEASSNYSFVDGEGKATLGATGATGGFVLPNNLVADLIKPQTQRAVYQSLVTVRNGVAVRGVDQPYRTGAPARATFQDWGGSRPVRRSRVPAAAG
jgi:hypothetical protein